MLSAGTMPKLSPVAPNCLNTLRLSPTFIINLHVHPESDHIRKCVYSLLNEDGSLHQRITAATDAIKEDDKLTLVFTDLHRGLRYTLEVDDGADGSYYLFYKAPLERLIEVDGNPEGTDEGPGDQDHPDDYGDLVFDETIPSLSNDLRQPFGAAGSGSDKYEEPTDERLAGGDAGLVIL